MMRVVVLLLGVLAAAHAQTCTRWQSFGFAGIDSAAGLTSITNGTQLATNGWTTNANQFTTGDQWKDYFIFCLSGGGVGYIEKPLPEGGDFVRVRYGNFFKGTTDVEVGGVNVGTAVNDLDVTTDADYTYTNGDTIKLMDRAAAVGNVLVWSIDICNYDSGACFHGDGTVLLESGSSKRFSDLSLGERIKTSDGRGGFSFNPVLTLPHANNTEPAAFLTLTTETGKKVDMTSDHFIPKCDQEQVTAGELAVGDCLLTVDGKETLTEISSTAKNGVFTAITQDKYIVVNGVVASPFSKDSDPTKPELDYEKYRLELEQNRNRKLARMNKLKKRLRGLGGA